MVDKVTTQKRSEEILAEWDLDNQMNRSYGLYESAQDIRITDTVSLDLSNTFSNVSLSSPNVYTIGPGNTTTTWSTGTTAPWFTHNPTGAKIQLDGEDADIAVNGWSLVDAVKSIERRLGLFQPNPELELEWEELRALGEQYRQLEQHIRDKQATFDRIKAMPAPEVD